MTRREFLQKSAMMIGAPLLLPGCAAHAAGEHYENAVRSVWRPFDGSVMNEPSALSLELVRYATLAPSSHNTQCWKFAIEPKAISILPDMTRRCPVVDPDDHHLFVSLGCAAENLVQAAQACGYRAIPHLEGGMVEHLRIGLQASKPVATPLFKAIPQRQCTRSEYDGKQLTAEEMALLERAGSGKGVRVLLFTEAAIIEKMLELLVQANMEQLNNPPFVSELLEWIRFSEQEAVEAGDGLFAGASGNPSVPRWIGQLLFDMFNTPKRENDKYVRQVRSSAGLAVFVSDADDKEHWIEAGRCYERFALQATALGIRNAFVNQPVEVAGTRSRLASMLGLGNARPDLIVRFGRGPEMPRSLRRPLSSVLA